MNENLKVSENSMLCSSLDSLPAYDVDGQCLLFGGHYYLVNLKNTLLLPVGN